MLDKLAGVLAREMFVDRDDAYEEIALQFCRMLANGRLWLDQECWASWSGIKCFAAREIRERRWTKNRLIGLPRLDTPEEREARADDLRPWIEAGRGEPLTWQSEDGSTQEVHADDDVVDPAVEAEANQLLDLLPPEVRELVALRAEGYSDRAIYQRLKIKTVEFDRRLDLAGRILAGVMAETRRLEMGWDRVIPDRSEPEPEPAAVDVPEPRPMPPTIADLARERGLNPETVYGRRRAGDSLEEALRPIRQPKRPNVSKLARERGLNPKTVYARRARGQTLEQALSDELPPKTTRRARLEALAAQHGISYSTLKSRVDKGWNPEVAARTPSRNQPPSPDSLPQEDRLPRGEVGRLAREHGISVSTLRQRLYVLKWPLERALTTPVRGRGKRRD